MAKLSISQLSAFTGKDRRTVTARLAGLDFEEGEDNGHFYDSVQALAAIFLSKNAKDALDEKRCQQIDLQMEIARKARMPIEVVTRIWDAGIQSFTAQLKAAKGKTLTVGKINELIEILRTAKLPVTW